MVYKGKNNLIGQQFGQLTVIEYVGDSKWKCLCSCGKETIVKTGHLNNGHTKSCGCLRGQASKGNTRNMGPKIDLTGKKFGKLTPQYYIKGGKWHCLCECGNECDVDTRNLNSGHTTSCGCYQKDKAAQNVIDMTGYEDDNIKVLERNESSPDGIAYWKCLCKHCGNIFSTKGTNIRTAYIQSCGCVHSKGEQKITKMLIDEGCEFSTQYTFPDLVGVRGGKLRFDFAIFLNNKLNCLVEFNGLQHYSKPEGKWGEEWDILIENDNRKKEYCKQHNIPLKIIKYDQDFTISDLIN